ncbi:MAG TPA: nucleotide exchange factor GrpE [Moheibacter sp.]|nr:nucleotide exchange factor GrpE [Moheibacter sp.]
MSEELIEEENVLDQENTTEKPSETELLKEQLQKEKDQFLRLFAEFDNFKKRTAKERLDIFKTANAETITSLLPILDDFERAIKEIGKSAEQQHLQGVQLIQNKMIETLRSKGLKALEINVGDDFNTDQMEAVTQIPAPSEELKGKVIDIIETGYALTDKIIRYAKVVVGQ